MIIPLRGFRFAPRLFVGCVVVDALPVVIYRDEKIAVPGQKTLWQQVEMLLYLAIIRATLYSSFLFLVFFFPLESVGPFFVAAFFLYFFFRRRPYLFLLFKNNAYAVRFFVYNKFMLLVQYAM